MTLPPPPPRHVVPADRHPLQALDDLPLDELDALLAEPMLDVPAGFDARVLALIEADAVGPDRPRVWGRAVLLLAGLLGLVECLSFVAALWLVTAVAR